MGTPKQVDSRRLEDLEPATRALAEKFLAEAAKAGFRVLIYSTFRNAARQNALYAQGRTAPGRKVTNARAGYSWHNFRRAFDFVPLTATGKADWGNTKAYQQLGAIGRELGLEWGGDWTGFKDLPHMQYTCGKTLADMRAEHGTEAAG